MSVDAIACHGEDNVATAVRDLSAGEFIRVSGRVSGGGDGTKLTLRDPIPFGHKFALKDIEAGRRVIKYGEEIGSATSIIRRGEHVHLHNVEGLRGRGDLR